MCVHAQIAAAEHLLPLTSCIDSLGGRAEGAVLCHQQVGLELHHARLVHSHLHLGSALLDGQQLPAVLVHASQREDALSCSKDSRSRGRDHRRQQETAGDSSREQRMEAASGVRVIRGSTHMQIK